MFAKKLLTRLELNTHQLLAVLAALLFMATSAYVVKRLVGNHYQAYLRSELQTILQSTTGAIPPDYQSSVMGNGSQMW